MFNDIIDVYIYYTCLLRLEPPTLGIIFLADNPEISAKPVKFTKVSHVFGKGVDEAFFWYPIAPPGYAAMGCIVTRTDEPPRVESFCCPRIDLVGPASIIEVPVSRSSSLKTSQCWSIWKVENQVKYIVFKFIHLSFSSLQLIPIW